MAKFFFFFFFFLFLFSKTSHNDLDLDPCILKVELAQEIIPSICMK